MILIIMALSTSLQFWAAYLSVRMVRITGKRGAWLLIALAITVGALRRGYDLFRFGFMNIDTRPHIMSELFSLLTSVCMVVGIAWIAPLFLSIKRSEESLRESETKFRIVSDNTYDWEYWLSPEGRFIYTSPSCKLISGYNADEFMADPDLRLRIIHPDDRESYRNHRLHVREQKASDEIEFRIVRADGTICWISHACQPVFDAQGNYIGIRGSNRDVTKRKDAEEAGQKVAKERQKLFEDMLDLYNNAPCGYHSLDKDGVYVLINDTELSWLGYGRSEIIRKKKFSDLITTGSKKTFYETFPVFKEKGSVKDIEVEMIRKDGTVLQVLLSATAINDSDGNFVMSRSTIYDITERRKAEEDKRKLEEQLQQVHRMDAIGQLAGGVAHDFNNLLTSIIGYSDLILTQLPENHFAKDKLKVIRDAGERAADLVSQLLAFSRKQMLEMRPLNLNEIVWNLSKIFTRTIGEDIELELNIMQPVKSILADAGQVEQILMNLVVNARDAMPDGGRLTIETDNVYLDETYSLMHSQLVKPGPYVMLSVADTGLGMSREVQEKMFEPFFTTKEVGKGTGLGLSTTHGIVRQHNGYIWIYSEPGTGTTFKVYFPAIEGTAKKMKKDEMPVTVKGVETILVVDDEPLVRQFVIDVLQQLGYQVIEANSAEEALKIGEQVKGKIDLLLTDLVMPGMKGSELGKLFIERWPGIKVILMSGYGDKPVFHDGLGENAIVFMQKPLTPRKLATVLREVLDRTSI